jgi:hypothetical protein
LWVGSGDETRDFLVQQNGGAEECPRSNQIVEFRFCHVISYRSQECRGAVVHHLALDIFFSLLRFFSVQLCLHLSFTHRHSWPSRPSLDLTVGTVLCKDSYIPLQ